MSIPMNQMPLPSDPSSHKTFAEILRSKDVRRPSGWMPAFGGALALSLGLFWLMHTVIHVSGMGPQKKEQLQTIDFVRLKRDSDVTPNERRKPPPPPPPKSPPPPAKMSVATDAPVGGPGIAAPGSLDLSADSGGPASGGASANMFDSDAVPLQRVNPMYPNEARRAGITGYVRLQLTIAPDGSVRAAKVIESKPKGLFDASAVTAVLKWRFKPKVVDGVPVDYVATQRIAFDLNK